MMRIVFMGTPDFAVPSLNQLIQDGHEIVGVYTQPDKPKNRGMKLTPPPVKVVAQANHLPVFQPKTLKDEAVQQELAALAPELIVVAAYGKLLPKAVLELPEKGCINVHSSLLPKYRGAAPINWAMLNGEEETGMTIMHMAAELDADKITLTLKDEGPGIPDIPQAMQEGFSTASPAVREMGFGAGMGLPNMKKNVDELTIESEVGVGTIVRMVTWFRKKE